MQTQTRLSSLIRIYTVCHSVCIVWTHYSMVEPHSSNFSVIRTNFWGVRIFRKFMVTLAEHNEGLWLRACRRWSGAPEWYSPCRTFIVPEAQAVIAFSALNSCSVITRWNMWVILVVAESEYWQRLPCFINYFICRILWFSCKMSKKALCGIYRRMVNCMWCISN